MWHKRLFIVLIILFSYSVSSFAQITYSPSVRSQNSNCIITCVQLTNDETIVTIKVPRSKQTGSWVSFSSATVLVPSDLLSIDKIRQLNLEIPDFLPTQATASLYADIIKRNREYRETFRESGCLIRSLGPDYLDTKYKIRPKKNEFYYFELHFDRLPRGCEDVYIRELVKNGYEWTGIKIKNPFPEVPNIGMNEIQIKQKINNQNDGIVGIFEGFSENKYKLACIKQNDEYKLIYLGSQVTLNQWKLGDVKATLRKSATPGYFKADWYMADKSVNSNVYVMFKASKMIVDIDNEKDEYLKMYPTNSSSSVDSEAAEQWSGTGFAMNNGYITTNYHVVENAQSIKVVGIHGDFNLEYNARVVATDKYNDLALISISDSRFSGFGPIPYRVKTITSEVGEEIFVLGYPLTSTMGDEIKLTTGVVSSKTGYQGDVSLYQISAPIQPGNSGGPLFDNKGNLIGIVSAKHKGAENVGYAIKASYLNNLVKSALSMDVLPSTNNISNLPLTNKVKSIKDFVFMIKCSSVKSSYLGNGASTKPADRKIVGDEIHVYNPQCTLDEDGSVKLKEIIITSYKTTLKFQYTNRYKRGS